ncbi:MAG TPA: hypothetical protein VJ142_00635 [Candidatus Nanoarchaeia archaeon]|nr:hypothetical protein [Candidatus Nanoarchaeia archaeon]
MSKRFILLVSALLFFLAINVVSATHNTYGYLGSGLGSGYGYGAYGYNSGYRDYGNDCGSGYGGYGYYGYRSPCRTDTLRDIVEKKHTTISTHSDGFTNQRVVTVKTTFRDVQIETRTPTYSPFYGYRTFYPSRTVIGNVGGYPYYDPYQDYYSWRYRY